MRVFLTFISLLLFVPYCFAQVNDCTMSCKMEARGHEFTGLCIISQADDDTTVGTIVNEMGVKAFDFTYAKGKAKVLNVIAPLNKWYIRKVLRGDMAFFLSNFRKGESANKGKRHLRFTNDGDISVSNDRFKIKYTFGPPPLYNSIPTE